MDLHLLNFYHQFRQHYCSAINELQELPNPAWSLIPHQVIISQEAYHKIQTFFLRIQYQRAKDCNILIRVLGHHL